jgi:hypothetical protein
MKTEMILAFKKKLSQIDNYNAIQIKEPTTRIFGGYTDITFDNFWLMQCFWDKWLDYNSSRVELTHEEWLELNDLVRERKSFLQKTDSCKDYIEIMNIINS